MYRGSAAGVGKDNWDVSECGAATRHRLKTRIMKDLPSHSEEFGFHPVSEAVNH